MAQDRLDEFGIYKLACQLFEDFWADSEVVGQDYRWLDDQHQHN